MSNAVLCGHRTRNRRVWARFDFGVTPYLVPALERLTLPISGFRAGHSHLIDLAARDGNSGVEAPVRARQGETKTGEFSSGIDGTQRACPKAGKHWRCLTSDIVQPSSERVGANQRNPIKLGALQIPAQSPHFLRRDSFRVLVLSYRPCEPSPNSQYDCLS